jgi:hypothetical protein
MTGSSTRLAIVFSIMAVAIVVQAAVLYGFASRSEAQVGRLVARDLGGGMDLAEIEIEMGKLRWFEKEFLIHVDSLEKRNRYAGQWKEAHIELREMLAKQTRNGSGIWKDRELQMFRQWDAVLTTYEKEFNALASSANSGAISTTSAANAALQESREAIKELAGRIEEAGQTHYVEAQASALAVRESFGTLYAALGLSLLASLAVTGTLFVVARNVLRGFGFGS